MPYIPVVHSNEINHFPSPDFTLQVSALEVDRPQNKAALRLSVKRSGLIDMTAPCLRSMLDSMKAYSAGWTNSSDPCPQP